MSKIKLLGIALLIIGCDLLATVKLPALIADHMILQQNSTVKVWGWADPGEEVKVKASWMEEELNTIANLEGEWMVSLTTLNAGQSHSMTIIGDNQITLKDILFGEVWFCSGQSNMEFTIEMLGGWDSKWYKKDKRIFQEKDLSQIRTFTVKRMISDQPEADCEGEWQPASLATIESFSATAWFFGLNLHEQTGVPIALISSSWGGTGAEVWMPEEKILENNDFAIFKEEPNKTEWWPGTPGVLYNGMVHPVLNYTIKGVIWYQGETNCPQSNVYSSMLESLASSWRAAWGSDVPFYYVQIAPFRYKEKYAAALLREAQLSATGSIGNSGIVITMDIGEVKDIHPKNKQEVGRRLALHAMKNNYADKDLQVNGPLYKYVRNEGDKMIVYFDHATQLEAGRMTLRQFKLAGEDRRFYKAKAKIRGNTVVVWTKKVPNPVAVRYAFESAAQGALFNEAGLPASSFRSDDWLISE
jgi:sialate O-acetylesterase